MNNNMLQGFTLIEVLIAMTILAIGLLALSSMQETSAQGNLTAREITQAVNISEKQIETLMNLTYANCTDSDGDGYSGLYDGLGGADNSLNATLNNKRYTVYWNVAENATENFKDIHFVIKLDNSDIVFNFAKSFMLN